MTAPEPVRAAAPPVRLAVDLLGGDGGTDAVAQAVAAWLADGSSGEPTDAARLVLVGPSEDARRALRAHGVDPAHPGLSFVEATGSIATGDPPVTALRTAGDTRAATVRAAAELVRAGGADALVSAGHTGAAVVATSLVWGRLPDALRPVLAVLLPARPRPVLLLDVGATPDASADVLVSHATAGVRHAIATGLSPAPRVGLLSIGSETGKGDQLRRSTAPLLDAAFGAAYVGLVEGGDVLDGDRADVVVTDGFTGNVLLKGLEAAVRWTLDLAGPPARAAVGRVLAPPYGAGVLLGVRGDAVLAHGAADAGAMVTALRVASDRVQRRRAAASGEVGTPA